MPDSQDLIDLLKLLIFELNTIDGQRDSADQLKKAISKERMKGSSLKAIENELFRKVILKYTIMRVRSKISYQAFARKMTICEMFCQTILYCCGKMILTESIDDPWIYPKETVDSFDKMMRSSCTNIFRKCQTINQCAVMRKRRQAFDRGSSASQVNKPPKNLRYSNEEKFPPAFFYEFNRKVMAKTSENIVKDYIRDRFGKLLIFDRTRCIEMFADVIVDDEAMYPPRSVKGSTAFKLRRQMLAEMVSKLNLVVGMRMVRDIFFVKVLLMKIELTKRLFVLDVEQGTETFIADDLS